MRERLARAYAVALALLVTGLAALFAERQNVPGGVTPSATGEAGSGAVPRVPPPDVTPDPAVTTRGREVFLSQGCLRCHRIAGEGSPRSPLDGVGARLFPDELRAWILGGEDVREGLPPSAARAKAAYRALPADALDDLVAYLASLR